jgi:Cu/Zn superoxide dismutase
MLRTLTIGAIAAFVLAFAVPAADAAKTKTVKYTATLDAKSEVPPTDSKGTGKAKLAYNPTTMELKYTITYKKLTGDAVAAHFHGPADAGVSAGVEVPITVSKSPIKGTATLTDAQASDLAAGKWYVNIHTAANPNGEIRGQVVAK